MSTVVHATHIPRPRLLALVLAVCAFGSSGTGAEAEEAAQRPTSDSEGTGDKAGLKKTKFEGLPHRQEWELFRQAYSPARDCPGGTAMLIEVAGSVFFLECQRIHP